MAKRKVPARRPSKRKKWKTTETVTHVTRRQQVAGLGSLHGKMDAGTRHWTTGDLIHRRTLSTSQAGDLKVDTGKVRVWLSRVGVADGAPYPHQITIERLMNGRWVTEKVYAGGDEPALNGLGCPDDVLVCRPMPKQEGLHGPVGDYASHIDQAWTAMHDGDPERAARHLRQALENGAPDATSRQLARQFLEMSSSAGFAGYR